MTLVEALETINRMNPGFPSATRVLLACGFTPLHLRTFLHAHLLRRFPQDNIEILTGLYGDLASNLERACGQPISSAAAVAEWTDLDSRLGIRQLGGWQPEVFPDILTSVRLSLGRLESALRRLTAGCPVALSLPSLPLPPLDLPAGWQAGAFELDLRQEVAGFAARACSIPELRILNPQRLDALSLQSQRFDAKSELLTGFPYRLEHAERLAALVASLLHNPSPKKGLITDLDETCWKGILGEVGVDGICWDLAGHAQLHGIYQQFLHALAQRGILIGAASKNDPALVELAFQRRDIHLPAESVFPVEAHWRPKSESVARILKTWNVGADAVVFVDDSPMELAEVQAAHPGVECLLFPKDDPNALLALLDRLRDLFGKPSLSEADRIRRQSIRNAGVLQDLVQAGVASYEKVLKQAEAQIHFSLVTAGGSARAFELVNKTNQFNLNGRRYREVEWQNYLRQDGAFLLAVSYKDKFGPLGEIAALLGRKLRDGNLRVDTWVMSCRAFSRRIEYQCLRYLFQKFNVDGIVFDWLKTPRNGPLCEFLSSLGTLEREFRLSRQQFDAQCPLLFHSVEERACE
jgi:FkbH-like protein